MKRSALPRVFDRRLTRQTDDHAVAAVGGPVARRGGRLLTNQPDQVGPAIGSDTADA